MRMEVDLALWLDVSPSANHIGSVQRVVFPSVAWNLEPNVLPLWVRKQQLHAANQPVIRRKPWASPILPLHRPLHRNGMMYVCMNVWMHACKYALPNEILQRKLIACNRYFRLFFMADSSTMASLFLSTNKFSGSRLCWRYGMVWYRIVMCSICYI